MVGSCSSKTNTVKEYDPSNDSWTSKTSAPTSRTEAMSALVDGKVSLIGGYTNDCSNINEMYDIENDSWSTKSSMGYARNYGRGGVINNKVYVIGGTCGGSTHFTYNEVYDPSID